MKVVVTGGTGFVGVTLARHLVALGRLAGPSGTQEAIDRIVLFDRELPAAHPPGLDARVELAAGDVTDRERVFDLVDRDDTSVFHLASVVSAGGERDFDLALRVNVDGTRNVLEACRARRGRPRLVFTSTLATFGGAAMPETVSDTTKQTPETTYGITKAIGELLVNDYTRKEFLDGRSARLPTVVIRPGAPNAAASGFASAVFREPLAGRSYALPVGLETRLPIAGVHTVVRALVALHDVAGDALGDDRAVNLPSLSVTVREMVESLRRVAGDARLGTLDVRPDPAVERITRTWPRYAACDRAERLGLPRDAGLDAIVRSYIEDAGGA